MVHLELVQVDVVEPVPRCKRACELVRIDDSGLDQRLADRPAVLARQGDGRLDHAPFGEAELDQNVTESPAWLQRAARTHVRGCGAFAC